MDFAKHEHHLGAKVLVRLVYDSAKAGHDQGMNPIPSVISRIRMVWLEVIETSATGFKGRDHAGVVSTHTWDEAKAWRFNDYAGT